MSLAAAYAEKIRAGEWQADAGQAAVVARLDNLANNIQPTTSSIGSFLKRWGKASSEPPRGLYIHGDVGRGKTMLMDLFFAHAQVSPKRRVHFHAFMQEVHAARANTKTSDVMGSIADGIADSARLLCLDEMQITDIADAMIIGRLFDALQARDVCFVTTSNLPPEDLYKDGLNRHLFAPFIARLRANLEVVALDSPHDYRLGRIKSHETFITPLSPASTRKLDQLWHDLTDGDTAEPMDIAVLGRKLRVPRTAHSCARFNFADLCENPLGPPDFLAIAKAFKTVFIDGIPVFESSQRNEAKRFVLMIDTFYDAGTRLVATAAAAPEDLYPKGQHGFEFKRTISRLREMQSASWWGKAIPET